MNTVLVLCDSVNRRFLSLYNESGPKRPNLERLAERSVVFDNHFTASAPCMPARRDIMTGSINFLETGGGMMPCPDQDRLNGKGLVSTCVFHDTGKLKTLMIFPSLFKGEHVKNEKFVYVRSGKKITVEFDAPTPLQIDGEVIKGVTKYSIFYK